MKYILALFSIFTICQAIDPKDLYIHFDHANQTLEEQFNDGKCRALAMRGGGTKGAYEVGALKMMTEMLPAQETAYDVVVGVSIGGMNAGMLATFQKGDEKNAVKAMYESWLSNPASEMWENWSILGPVEGLWRSSFLDNTKLANAIGKVVDGKPFKRMIAIQSVDLDTGEIVIFDETTPLGLTSQAILSSASIPVIFPVIRLNKQVLVDGGLFTNLDMAEAIIKCRERGFEDKDIIVDVIMCFDKVVTVDEWSKEFHKYKNAFEIYLRKEDLRNFYYYYEDVTRVVAGYPNVQFRHLLTPQVPLNGGWLPIFDGIDQIEFLLEQGEIDTKKSLQGYLDSLEQESNHEQQVQSGKPKVQSSKQYKSGFDKIREIIEYQKTNEL